MANIISIERRNSRDLVERLDDGTIKVVQQDGQNFYNRDTGAWEPSDSNIYPDTTIPGFSHNSKAGQGRVRLAPGGKFRFGLKHPLFVTYTPRGANAVIPSVSGNKAHFAGLWPSVDVELTKFPEGMKEDLLLLDASAPSSYVWDLEELAGVVPTPVADGGLDYVETLTGQVAGRIPAPTVHDKAGVPGPATLTYAPGAITIAVDSVWLTDPARVWPVTLDPTTVIQPDPTAGKDTYVQQSTPTTNYGTSTSLVVGDTTTASQATRSYLQPDLSSIPTGGAIISAQLELYNTGTGFANALTASIYRVTAAWTETGITWDTQPAFDTTVQSTASNIPNTVGWVAWTGLATLVQNWFAGTWTNYGIVVKKATDGTNAGDNKAFYSSDYTADPALRPKWTITYTQPTVTITTPNGTQATPTQINDDITPDLSGVYNSADAVNMAHRQHQVYDESNNLLWDSTKTAATATPGSTVTVAVPLAAGLKYGTKYKWRWMAWDTNGAFSAWSAEGWFLCVLTAPTTPTITPNASAARIDASWTAKTADNLAGYNLYRKPQGDPDTSYAKVNLSLLTGLSTSDDTAASAKSYTYALTAAASDGYESAKSTGANGSVTFAGYWLNGAQVMLREPPHFSRDRRVSRRLALDGTWQIQDRGFATPQVDLAIRFASLTERDNILTLFPADTAVSYRDEQGFVLRGKMTSSEDEERVPVGTAVYGVVRVTLTEVTA